MTSLIKFELGKILRNRTVFGGIVVGCLVLLGIFFVGYHYSQLSMSEASNKKKGFEKSLDVIIDEKYSGEFTDEKVKMILSDSMNNFQENEEKKVEDQLDQQGISFHSCSPFLYCLGVTPTTCLKR